MKNAPLLLAAAVLAACAHVPPPAPPQPKPQLWSPLAQIYYPYVEAIERHDLAEAEKYVSAGKRQHLDTMSPAEALAAIDVVPGKSDFEPYQEMVHLPEGKATLIMRGKIGGKVATGRIEFVREEGAWKIASESWDIGTAPGNKSP